MEVRSHAALALALSFLASAAGLGLMVHDAAVGGPSASALREGDEVRIRGAVQDGGEPPLALDAPFMWLASDAWAGPIIVFGEGLPDAGTWVVHGSVEAMMPWIDDGTLLILNVLDLDEPILFS